jgi:hypothetical protein
MGDVAQVAIQIVLIGIAFEEIGLSYQVIDDVGLFLFVFEICHLRSSVGGVSHVRGHSYKVFIAFCVLHSSLA